MSAARPFRPEPLASDTGRGRADVQEAWAIAAELIADLGAGDAVGWAEDYMKTLQERGDDYGMNRWVLVTSALGELAHARVH